MLKEITKRDGSIVEFDPNKINIAIKKAFVSARGESDDELIGKLTKAVVRYLKANVPEDTTKTTIEDVQDAVEHVLIKYNLPKVAKEYILYRDLHNKIRTNKNILLDSYKLVGEYVDKVDWRVNENANSGYSYASMLNHISGSVVANYTLANTYPERIAKAHIDGDFHIHDLSAGIIPYCMGHSLKDLLMMGFIGVSGRASSKPAKHLDAALQQISNFMATLQTEAAGAQAFSSWDTYLAPFVRYDKLSYNQVKQMVQQFIFGLNICSRWGQPPFTNITLDLVPPHDLKDMPVIIGGELQDTTYGEYQKEMDMLNMAFIETMLEGDAEGKVFTFPIPTYNIVKDFNWDSEISHKLFELTCKYGSPYFANFLNSDMDVSDSRSMCPMDGNTKVIVKDNDNDFKVCTIADVYDAYTNGNHELQTITPDGWKKAIPNRIEPTDVYHITLSNMIEVILGENHIQPVIVENGKALTLKAKDLKEGMYIPCNEYDCNNELFTKEFNHIVNHKITKVERKANSNYLYCFEVDNDSHTFYLANGMLTHNCRLRLDVKELRRKNGGLFGSGEKTGCYDDQTEVLTNNGWKLFKDVLPDDEICTLSSKSEIEYHKPIQSFVYDYDGELIHFKSLKSDLMVTPNHRMLYADKHNHKHGFVNAEDYSITKHPIPNKGTWRGDKYSASIFELPAIKSEWKSGNYGSNQIKKWDAIAIDMITWVKFLGLWLSEGSVDNINIAPTHGYRVTISQTKEHNLKYIEEILDSMPFKWVYDGKDFIICNKQLWTYMKQFGKQKDRYVPTYVKDLGADYIAAFLYALWLGDGSVHKTSGQSVYYTTSKQLADDVQELLVKAGYQASMHQRKPRICKIGDRAINSSMICYEVSVRFSAYTYLNDKISKRVPYRGKVYCLEVPNNTMMVRRNGYTLWCGNSVGVVTINMPRLGYLSKTKEEFFSKLEYLMILAKDSLEIKRKVAQRSIDNGLLPYTKTYIISLKNHFSTIGLVGMNEACLNLLGVDITTPEGNAFAVETMKFMRAKLSEFQEESDNLFNLEGSPAEATSYRLAKIDKKKFGDIITAGTDENPYYTNSTQIPVGYTDDIFEACDLQNEVQSLYTGGTVEHLYLGERLEDPAQAAKLIKTLCTNYKIPYFSITPTFSICKVHGYIPGNHSECPYDKGPIERPAK